MDDPNKRRHIFGNPEHHLEVLVRQYGSEEAAGAAIENAATSALRDATLIIDSSGHYRQLFDIGGYQVNVVGKVVNGIPRVGSAWIRR